MSLLDLVKIPNPFLTRWKPTQDRVSKLPLAKALYAAEVPIIDPASVDHYKQVKKSAFLRKKRKNKWIEKLVDLLALSVFTGAGCATTVPINLLSFSTWAWVWGIVTFIWFVRSMKDYQRLNRFLLYDRMAPRWNIHTVADPKEDKSYIWRKAPAEAHRLARYVQEVVPGCRYEVHWFDTDPFLFVRRGVEYYAIFVWDESGDFPEVEL